jgi:hypothetical protein
MQGIRVHIYVTSSRKECLIECTAVTKYLSAHKEGSRNENLAANSGETQHNEFRKHDV